MTGGEISDRKVSCLEGKKEVALRVLLQCTAKISANPGLEHIETREGGGNLRAGKILRVEDERRGETETQNNLT